MSKITHLKNATYKEEISKGVSFVAFWAPWCGPCRMMAPVYEQIAEELPEVKVCKVNTDEEQDISVEYGIRSIPTLLIIKDGVVVDTLVGGNPKTLLIEKIKKHM